MDTISNVNFPIDQAEKSHSRFLALNTNVVGMTEGQTFIRNMLLAMQEAGLTEAELSVKAGLNRRAVTDLREGRVASPKVSTVFALAKALNCDPGVMLGLGPRHKIESSLAQFLEKYPAADQERFLVALAAISPPPADKQ